MHFYHHFLLKCAQHKQVSVELFLYRIMVLFLRFLATMSTITITTTIGVVWLELPRYYYSGTFINIRAELYTGQMLSFLRTNIIKALQFLDQELISYRYSPSSRWGNLFITRSSAVAVNSRSYRLQGIRRAVRMDAFFYIARVCVVFDSIFRCILWLNDTSCSKSA